MIIRKRADSLVIIYTVFHIGRRHPNLQLYVFWFTENRLITAKAT